MRHDEEEADEGEDDVQRGLLQDSSAPSDQDLTVDEALDLMGFGAFQLRMFFLCGMGNFVEALEVAMISVVFPVLKNEWQLQNWQLALEASFAVIGMFVGAVGLGRLSDRIGRRPIFQLSLFVSSLFGFLSALSPNIYYMTLFRFFMGVGYGGNIVTDTVMLAEILPVKNRGYWLSLLDVFFGVGAIFIVGFTWLFMPRYGWRFIIAVSAGPAFLMLFFRRGVPESPRYLMLRGRREEARKVMVGIARENNVDAATMRRVERMHVQRQVHTQDEQVFDVESYQSLIANPVLRPVTITLLGCWFFNASAGTVFAWLPLFMEKTHLKGKSDHPMTDAYKSAMSIACGALFGAVLLSLVVPFFERRTLLQGCFASITVMIFSMQFAGSVNTIMLLLAVCGAISGAVTTMLYIFTPEAYPTPVRTTGLGLMSACHRLAPAIAHWLSAYVMHLSLSSISCIFAGLYAMAFTFSMLIPFDTKGRTLAASYYNTVEEVVDKRRASLQGPPPPITGAVVYDGL